MDGRKVLCIRFEDIPDVHSLSYTKAPFVEEVKKTKTGKANIKWCFPSGPKKATAIFVDCLPEGIQTLVKGIYFTLYHILNTSIFKLVHSLFTLLYTLQRWCLCNLEPYQDMNAKLKCSEVSMFTFSFERPYPNRNDEGINIPLHLFLLLII